MLQIDDVRPEDAGPYTVVAKNPAGEDKTTATLNVVPEKGGEEKKPGNGRPQGKTPRPVEAAPGVDFQPTEAKPSAPEENRPPRIIVPLKDGDVKESMPVILTATIDAGSPMATVSIVVFCARSVK